MALLNGEGIVIGVLAPLILKAPGQGPGPVLSVDAGDEAKGHVGSGGNAR